jgi:hypothetical protein
VSNPVTRLADLPDEVLNCLIGGDRHRWELVALGRKTQWGTPHDRRCTSCGKHRLDTVDSTGRLSVRQYEPRNGYPNHPYVEAHTSDDVRLEIMTRARRRARANLRAV